MSLKLFALGTALTPIPAVYGLAVFVAARQPAPPPLPMGASAALALTGGALLAFAACVWGLHRSFMARLRARRENTEA